MAGNRRQRRRRKPLTIIDSNRWLTRKHPNPADIRLRQLLSGLPQTNFSIQHHILFRKHSWLNEYNHSLRSAPAVTKSWLPTATRCGGALNRRPQLRCVIEGRPKSPNPHECRRVLYHSFECTISDPFDDSSKKEYMELTSVVDHGGGKYYAISLQGVIAAMDVTDPSRRCLEITAVGVTRAVPSPRSCFFKEYLFEMEGEILLIQLIHEESVEVVNDVEVYRLDLNKLDWRKVERLRGKTMFLKERCEWVNSAEYGCRDDCVFFTEGKENTWRVYHFKTGCISSV